MSRTSLEQGQHAERACCEYLQQQGLRMLQRNYRSRHGEIDLVMQDRDMLVFVEVRYRSNALYGGALESITPQKQQRIKATAEHYLQNESSLRNARIDVVAMSQKLQNTATGAVEAYSFDWIRDAF